MDDIIIEEKQTAKPADVTASKFEKSDYELKAESDRYKTRKRYPHGEIVLTLKELTKRFGERVSVDCVTLDVYSGEIFGFLGPNGAGKTTTIRMIAGLASITGGEAFVCGHSIKAGFKQAVRNLGGIIENPEMYKYMTGWDNLRYYANLYGGISDEQITDVVKLVRMEKRIHEKVRRYSLGMRQRVGIAQSLLHDPRLLILDEPTNGLDPAGIHEMRDFLKMLAHEFGIAVFISSHILTEMQLMCDRVGIISSGKLLAIKTIDEWTRSEKATVKMKLVASEPERAAAIISDRFGCGIESGGNMLIFNIPSERISEISLMLAGEGIAVLSLTKGEKSLEETFLELTATAGMAIT